MAVSIRFLPLARNPFMPRAWVWLPVLLLITTIISMWGIVPELSLKLTRNAKFSFLLLWSPASRPTIWLLMMSKTFMSPGLPLQVTITSIKSPPRAMSLPTLPDWGDHREWPLMLKETSLSLLLWEGGEELFVSRANARQTLLWPVTICLDWPLAFTETSISPAIIQFLNSILERLEGLCLEGREE